MKTTEEIYEGLLTAFAQRRGSHRRADCDLSVRLYAAAAELQSLDIQAEWVLDQSFPQTGPGDISGSSRPDAGHRPDSGHPRGGDHTVHCCAGVYGAPVH